MGNSYKALYRKWRPQVFSDVIGQEHITSVLKSEVMQGSVSHAYLFCGSRGTGKTTCAKILARAVSCDNPKGGDPCGVCPSCIAAENSLDIYEIDAASYNGVDNIRELRDTVAYPPAELKKRVFIIDEVHMLSIGAFNALLKTLEEPPEHILFILATTELGKIPATILSRCKRFDFRRITSEKIAERLRFISEKENIKISSKALMLIARLAGGAMRDALSMLELFIMSDHEVSEEEAAESLGVVGRETAVELADAISSCNCEKTLQIIAGAYNNSKDLSALCSELSEVFRDLMIIKNTKLPEKYMDLSENEFSSLKKISEKISAPQLAFCINVCEETQRKMYSPALSRRTIIETAMIRLCNPSLSCDINSLVSRICALEEKLSSVKTSSKTLFEHSANEPFESVKEKSSSAPELSESSPDKSEPQKIPEENDVPFDGPYTNFGSSAPSFKDPSASSAKPVSAPPAEDFESTSLSVAETKASSASDPAILSVAENSDFSSSSSAGSAKTSENAAKDGSSLQNLFMEYEEFTESVGLKNKILYSMLKGGRAFICGNTIELEAPNFIAQSLFSQDANFVVLKECLEKYLNFDPILKIVPKKNSKKDEKTDLSGLM